MGDQDFGTFILGEEEEFPQEEIDFGTTILEKATEEIDFGTTILEKAPVEEIDFGSNLILSDTVSSLAVDVTADSGPGVIADTPRAFQFRKYLDELSMRGGEDAAADVESAEYLGRFFKIPASMAYDILPILADAAGEKTGVKFFEGIKNSYTNGLLENQMNAIGFNMVNSIIAGDYDRMNEQIEQIGEIGTNRLAVPSKADNLLSRIASGLAGQLPRLMEAANESVLYGVAGAGAGAVVGAPFGGVGALPGAIAGFAVMQTAGMVISFSEQMIGATLVDFLDLGMAPPVALGLAVPVGILMALLEKAQFKKAIALVPGLSSGIGKVFQKAATSLVGKDGALAAVARGAARTAGTYAQELTEEMAQKGVEVVGRNAGIALENYLHENDIEQDTISEILNEFATEFEAAAVTLIGMVGIPGLAGTAVDAVSAEPKAEVGPNGGRPVDLPEGMELEIEEVPARASETEESEVSINEDEWLFTQEGSHEVSAATPISEDEWMEQQQRETEDQTNISEEFGPEARAKIDEADILSSNTPDEFVDFAKAMYDEDSLPDDAELKALWEATKTEEDERVPSITETNESFVESVSTIEGMQSYLGDLSLFIDQEAAKLVDRGMTKKEAASTLSAMWDRNVWANALRIGKSGKPLTETSFRIILGKAKKSPERFRTLLASLQGNTEELRAIQEQMKAKIELEAEAEKAVPQEEIDVEALRLQFLRGQTRWRDVVQPGQEFIRQEGFEKPAGTQKETFAAGKRTRAAIDKSRREASKQRNYFKKVAEYITKDRKNSAINIDEKRQIKILGAGIEARFFGKEQQAARDDMREYLKRRPEVAATLPKKELRNIMLKTLDELTIGELEERAQAISDLEEQGRRTLQMKMEFEQKEFDRARDAVVLGVLRGKDLVPETELGGSIKKKGSKRPVKAVESVSWGMQRLLDDMDGGQNFNGPVHKYFWNKGMDIRDDEKINRAMRADEIKKARKGLGIKMLELTKPIEKKSTYSRDDVVDMYMAMQNEEKAAALIHGDKIKVEEVERLIGKLSTEEKAWGDWIIEHGYEDHVDRVNEAFVNYTTSSGKPRDMALASRYSPIRHIDPGYEGVLQELQDEVSERAGLKKAYADKSFTIERVENIDPKKMKPMRLGATRTLLEQVAKQETFIANGLRIKELQKMVADPSLRAAVKQTKGPAYVDQLEEWVNILADPDFYNNQARSTKKAKKVLKFLRKNLGKGALSYNTVTPLKQLPSAMLMIPESGAYNFIWGMQRAIAHPIETQKLMDTEPQIKERSIDRLMEEMKKSDPNTYKRIMDKIGKVGFVGIWAMDRAAITPGWMGVYHKSKRQGLSEKESKRNATNAVLRTQPVGDPKDVAAIYRTKDEMVAALLQFSTQLSQLYGIVTHDIPSQFKIGARALKNKDGKGFLEAAKTAGISSAVIMANVASIWMISNRRRPESEEDMKDMLSTGFLNYFPAVGDSIASGVKGWDANGTPIEELFNQLGKALGTGKEKDINRLLENIALYGVGLPVIQYRRVKKYADTKDSVELIGGVRE